MTSSATTRIGRLFALAALPAALTFASAASVLATDLGQECTNSDVGYAVAFPTDWWTNEAEEGADEGMEGYAACVFFAEEPADVPANAGLPPTVAINFSVESASPPPGEGATVVDEREDTAGGRPATVRELEMSDAGAPFFRDGDRVYAYLIEMDRGDTLVVATDSTRNGDYASHKATLDAMMDSLAFTGAAQLPDTALPATAR